MKIGLDMKSGKLKEFKSLIKKVFIEIENIEKVNINTIKGVKENITRLDIIISDQMCRDNIQFFKKINHNGSVILILDFENKVALKRASQLGVDYIMSKKFNAYEFKCIIEQLIERKRLWTIIHKTFKSVEVNGKFESDLDFDNNIVNEFERLKRVEEEYWKIKMKTRLTNGELKILNLIEKGYTQTEIAMKLYVTISTVKNHVTNILKKTGIKTSKEVAIIVKNLRLI